MGIKTTSFFSAVFDDFGAHCGLNIASWLPQFWRGWDPKISENRCYVFLRSIPDLFLEPSYFCIFEHNRRMLSGNPNIGLSHVQPSLREHHDLAVPTFRGPLYGLHTFDQREKGGDNA